MSRRILNETEKQQVKNQQRNSDRSLNCFISGEIIGPDDEVEYDHVDPLAKGGDNDLSNFRVVLKKYHQRKGIRSLYEVRDNLLLDRLFESNKNAVKLQDILELKGINIRPFRATSSTNEIEIGDGTDTRKFHILHDRVLRVPYFYGQLPVKWLENDDQEGLQPRVLDYKKLLLLREHLKDRPQLAPSIARLINGKLKLFDGQHKLAAQVLNSIDILDIKVYISPEDPVEARNLFDELMKTNLEAHSKHRQTPFTPSTMLERLSVIHRELLHDFINTNPQEKITEVNFVHFLVSDKNYSRADANHILKSALMEEAKEKSSLKPYTADAPKDQKYPISFEILKKAIFPNLLFLESAPELIGGEFFRRDSELQNYLIIAQMLMEHTRISEWVTVQRNKAYDSVQLKARRIWHKGSVITWGPYLKDIVINAFNMRTELERTRLLYREEMSDDVKQRIQSCIERLFQHPLWDEPEGTLDSLLVSAQKQNDLFDQKGLTINYVLTGYTG